MTDHKPPFLQELEVMRGVAALTVVLGHATIASSYGDVRDVYAHTVGDLGLTVPGLVRFGLAVLGNGGAVTVFFVMSGFVLMRAYDSMRRTAEPYRAFGFFVRRIFRIYPMLILSLGAVWAYRSFVQQHFTFPDRSIWLDLPAGMPIDAARFFDNVIFRDASINNVTWTLGLEMLFSALVPLIWHLRAYAGSAALYVLLAILILVQPLPAASGQFAYAAAFIAGAVLDRHPPKVMNNAVPIIAWCLLCFPRGFVDFGDRFWLAVDAEILAGVLLVMWIAGRSPVTSRTAAPPLVLLGRTSFSLYAIHVPIIYGIVDILDPSPAATLAIVTVLALAASILFYFLVEGPMIRMGHRLSLRIAGSTAVPLAAPDTAPKSAP